MQHAAAMPGKALDVKKMPGHWVLARLGKRVLRPGGRQLTHTMLRALDIQPHDRVVEFAPGMGATARLTIERGPASYIGVERDKDAALRLCAFVDGPGRRIQQASAEESGLPAASATVLYGEAMLSMQPDATKHAIVHEAARLLMPGGRYAIHELSVLPDAISEDLRQEIRAELTSDIHVGVRPMTPREWRDLLEEAGFDVAFEARAPMHLLEVGRLIRDEGIGGFLRILWNAAREPEARARALTMRGSFRRYRNHLGAITLVATKSGRRTEPLSPEAVVAAR